MIKVPVYNSDFKRLDEVYLQPGEIDYLKRSGRVQIAYTNGLPSVIDRSEPLSEFRLNCLTFSLHHDYRTNGNPIRVVFLGDENEFSEWAAFREAHYWDRFWR